MQMFAFYEEEVRPAARRKARYTGRSAPMQVPAKHS